jgi:hypothetical protein
VRARYADDAPEAAGTGSAVPLPVEAEA